MLNIIKNENGFTLIEVLFTIIIVGILSTSILSLFTNSSIRQQKASRELIAIHFAQAGIEQILHDSNDKGFDYIIIENYPTQHHKNVERSISIHTINNNLKQIIVKVAWMTQVDSLVTLICNY